MYCDGQVFYLSDVMLHKFYINRSRSRFCSFLLQIYEFWGCSDLWGLLYKYRIDKKSPFNVRFQNKISPWLGLEPTKMISFYSALFFFHLSIGWIIFSHIWFWTQPCPPALGWTFRMSLQAKKRIKLFNTVSWPIINF